MTELNHSLHFAGFFYWVVSTKCDRISLEPISDKRIVDQTKRPIASGAAAGIFRVPIYIQSFDDRGELPVQGDAPHGKSCPGALTPGSFQHTSKIFHTALQGTTLLLSSNQPIDMLLESFSKR